MTEDHKGVRMTDLKAKRDEAEKQREQALASVNFLAGMVRAYDELIAAGAILPDPPTPPRTTIPEDGDA